MNQKYTTMKLGSEHTNQQLQQIGEELLQKMQGANSIQIDCPKNYSRPRHIAYLYIMCWAYKMPVFLSSNANIVINTQGDSSATAARNNITTLNHNLDNENTTPNLIFILNNYHQILNSKTKTKADANKEVQSLVNKSKIQVEDGSKYSFTLNSNSIDDMAITLQALANVISRKRNSKIVLSKELLNAINNNPAYLTVYTAIINSAKNGHAMQTVPGSNLTNLLSFDAISALRDKIINDYYQIFGLENSSEFLANPRKHIINTETPEEVAPKAKQVNRKSKVSPRRQQ